ncbi:hypothetical protein K491DRAFT_690046 [Lophiostoma macrostomum CBS 122681]|jgi:hypothetical protein|uniref:Uncharacterized protein n=1 Tax=Lophiostoma macrostomum CBS 122681 TaxID=1314788 RepID=A0A6A6TGE8_9PLEO|nr:hypothetical protein K491DRAFT_690046 [Lophiostoma macrostomum CBS 122681]
MSRKERPFYVSDSQSILLGSSACRLKGAGTVFVTAEGCPEGFPGFTNAYGMAHPKSIRTLDRHGRNGRQ